MGWPWRIATAHAVTLSFADGSTRQNAAGLPPVKVVMTVGSGSGVTGPVSGDAGAAVASGGGSAGI